MKRQISTILCASFAASLCLAGGIALSSAGTTSAATSDDTFITPYSYEQYLPLSEPSDVAITGDKENKMIAVADGNSIHVYTEEEGAYNTYNHDTGAIRKLQFSGESLYFLDSMGQLYSLNPYDLTRTTITGIKCTTFAIDGLSLYHSLYVEEFSTLHKETYDTQSGWSTNSPSILDEEEDIYGTTTLTVKDHQLYYVSSGMKLVHYPSKTTWELPTTISSVSIIGDYAYYTSKRNENSGANFYVYDLTKNQIVSEYPRGTSPKGYSAVSQYDGKIYVVKDQTVQEFDPSTRQFTGYEIGTSSPSQNRLFDAKNSVLYKGVLYTIDKGRISVYDTKAKTYKTIPTTFDGDLISTDGESVLLAKKGSYTAKLYAMNGAETSVTLKGNSSDGISGITCVHGQYYYVTNDREYGKIGKDGDTERKNRPSHSTVSPILLTSDVQGFLYVLTTEGKVYRMDEEAFFSTSAFSEPLYTGVPSNATKLLVDYKQNVYALTPDNSILKYSPDKKDGASATYPLSKTLAYTQTVDTPVTTVAFGVESAEAYVLYNGNLMISTLDLELPCMASISTNDVDNEVFSEGVADFTVVKAAKGTLLIEFDLETLADKDFFPYVDYLRTSEERTALKIGTTGEYALLAIFDSNDHDYHTYLAKDDSSLIPVAAADYRVDYTQEKVGWLSSTANLYKFPYLTGLLTVTELSKNQPLTIVGEINNLDHNYYRVQYEENGTTKEGYVPQSFVNFFDSTPPTHNESIVGEGTADTDATWRLVFILLGCAAIIILVDFMILRPQKKDKEDEE